MPCGAGAFWFWVAFWSRWARCYASGKNLRRNHPPRRLSLVVPRLLRGRRATIRRGRQQPTSGRTAPDQRPATEAPGRQVALQGKTAHEPTGLREHGLRKTVGPDPARPVHQRSEERPASAGWDAQGPGRNAQPPGRQVAEQRKPVHEAKPAHEPSREQARDPGPREPVGQDPEHQRPQPQKSDKDYVSRPVHEQPVPQTSHNSHGSESSGQQVEEGTGAADQHSKPAIPAGKENVYPEGKSSAGPPEQSPRPFEHVVAAGPKFDKT